MLFGLIVFAFQTVTKTMPEDNVHRGDAELGGCQNHSHYHNVLIFKPSLVLSIVHALL